LEKSLATNASEALQIVDHARLKQRLIQENFMFAHHRQIGVIRDLLDSQRIGALRCLRSSFGFPPFPDPTNIRYSRPLGGGALLDAGAYTLKVAQLLLGNQLEVLSSVLTYDESKGVDVYGGLFLADSTGVVIETAFGFDQFYQCNLEIWGSKGKITAERIFTAGPGVVPKIRIEEAGASEVIEIETDNHFLNLLTHFAATLRTGNYDVSYEEVLSQARLLQSCRDKALTFSTL
jgi:predicted dehydrogenase